VLLFAAPRDAAKADVFQLMSAVVIDVGARLVRREGIDIRLAPKAFELLLILVRNQPNAVSHEQLHAALWPGVHVSETSLAALITQLRKALGDSADGGHVIRTLHRVGYAFIGDAILAGRTTAVAVPSCRVMWRGQSFDVPPGESVIGRDRACAIHIDADSISRLHARLHVSDSEVSIEDLGSKNGTWVDGGRIAGIVPLTDRGSFRLGSETVRLELTGDERPTKTALP
jgi:DNA-binding winged helix-turn-helix (wHTH) protein